MAELYKQLTVWIKEKQPVKLKQIAGKLRFSLSNCIKMPASCLCITGK